MKSWKWADVYNFTAESTKEIWDEESEQHTNIKGIETLEVTFKTTDDGALGPLHVYLDKKTKKVLGIALRK
ncbi:hypothetical protein [Bacillus sp. UNCCL13]|uniref:hypothetical protein n=1 Tax=Bacillus sp. UNCCL13 TaxID=1502772 RepID=UPI001C313C96|nr:hypothetical protein [Bacillus sp. UNCCL13]